MVLDSEDIEEFTSNDLKGGQAMSDSEARGSQYGSLEKVQLLQVLLNAFCTATKLPFKKLRWVDEIEFTQGDLNEWLGYGD